jgi:hypothetical protein
MGNAAYRTPNATVPAWSAAAVVPSDSVEINCTRGLFVGVGGNITVDMAVQGSNITFVNVPSGTLLPLQVTRVYLAGTSASSILALY